MVRATEFVHLVLGQSLAPGDWAVDATVGNGHDTLFLANAVGPAGIVFGFDVQDAALAATAQRVNGLHQVKLFHCGHECLTERMPASAKGRVGVVMFNLGYLPGGNKEHCTQAATTLSGLEQAIAYLKTGGLITLVLYPGHASGADEASAVRSYVERLPQTYAATRYFRLNSLQPAPEVLMIERLT